MSVEKEEERGNGKGRCRGSGEEERGGVVGLEREAERKEGNYKRRE